MLSPVYDARVLNIFISLPRANRASGIHENRYMIISLKTHILHRRMNGILSLLKPQTINDLLIDRQANTPIRAFPNRLVI